MVAVCACVSGLADAVPQGRALNNFVRELVNAPLHDGEYRFSLGQDGWVFIGFDAPHFGMTGYDTGIYNRSVGQPGVMLPWRDAAAVHIQTGNDAFCQHSISSLSA